MDGAFLIFKTCAGGLSSQNAGDGNYEKENKNQNADSGGVSQHFLPIGAFHFEDAGVVADET